MITFYDCPYAEDKLKLILDMCGRVRNKILNRPQLFSWTSSIRQESMRPQLPSHSVNAYLTCKSPISSPRCSLIPEGFLALLPRMLSTLFADTQTVHIIPRHQYCRWCFTDQKTEGPHKFQKTCCNVFNQWGTSCQIPDTQWGFRFTHSVIINIIISNPEADLFMESYTVFLIDLHLFSD